MLGTPSVMCRNHSIKKGGAVSFPDTQERGTYRELAAIVAFPKGCYGRGRATAVPGCGPACPAFPVESNESPHESPSLSRLTSLRLHLRVDLEGDAFGTGRVRRVVSGRAPGSRMRVWSSSSRRRPAGTNTKSNRDTKAHRL